MHKKRIITIAGRPGSGKSSSAKRVATLLGYEHFSSGDLFRSLAKERGLDILQANLSAEENAELDHLVDGRLRQMGETEDKLVIDSRTAWHWMPQSYKVFLDLDLLIASRRILEQGDHARAHSEDIHPDYEEYARTLQKRLRSETKRYKSLYDIDPNDMTNYDLVLDTAANDLDKTVALIVQHFKEWSDR